MRQSPPHFSPVSAILFRQTFPPRYPGCSAHQPGPAVGLWNHPAFPCWKQQWNKENWRRWSGYITYIRIIRIYLQVQGKLEWTTHEILKLPKHESCTEGNMPCLTKLKNGSNYLSPEPGKLLEHDYRKQPCPVDMANGWTKPHLVVAISREKPSTTII